MRDQPRDPVRRVPRWQLPAA